MKVAMNETKRIFKMRVIERAHDALRFFHQKGWISDKKFAHYSAKMMRDHARLVGGAR